jgi:hypothetical protein
MPGNSLPTHPLTVRKHVLHCSPASAVLHCTIARLRNSRPSSSQTAYIDGTLMACSSDSCLLPTQHYAYIMQLSVPCNTRGCDVCPGLDDHKEIHIVLWMYSLEMADIVATYIDPSTAVAGARKAPVARGSCACVILCRVSVWAIWIVTGRTLYCEGKMRSGHRCPIR